MTDTTTRAGQWMQTFTGRAFYPLDPHVDDIDPIDIAHALSMLCRYGGHSSRFYSVAEHCVLMSHAVAPENALWALLHDATEAFMGDLIRPLKGMMPTYVEAEDRLMQVICQRFGLDPVFPDEVKQADLRILRDERDALMVAPPQPWESIEGQPPLGVTVHCWAPMAAEQHFRRRLVELTWPQPRSDPRRRPAMPTTNPPTTVQAAADRVYAAALRRAATEADDNATGRLTAAGSADLDYVQGQWFDALDAYVTARNAEGGNR